MKKLLFSLLLAAIGSSSFAQQSQNAFVAINTLQQSGCSVDATLYASCPSLGGTGACGEIVTNLISVAGGSFACYGCSIGNGPLGIQNTVGFASIPAALPSSGAPPSDFEWNYAHVVVTCSQPPNCLPLVFTTDIGLPNLM